MTAKQVLFRLDDSELIALDNKLSDKGLTKQFFFSKCVELFLENKLSLDSNVITNDNIEIVEIKKQLAVIFDRLSKLEVLNICNINNNEMNNITISHSEVEGIKLPSESVEKLDDHLLEIYNNTVPSEILAIAVGTSFSNKELTSLFESLGISLDKDALAIARKNDFSKLPNWFSSVFVSQGSGVSARWFKI